MLEDIKVGQKLQSDSDDRIYTVIVISKESKNHPIIVANWNGDLVDGVSYKGYSANWDDKYKLCNPFLEVRKGEVLVFKDNNNTGDTYIKVFDSIESDSSINVSDGGEKVSVFDLTSGYSVALLSKNIYALTLTKAQKLNSVINPQ